MSTIGAPLTTPRLDLVPLRTEDADEMVSVLADARLYAFTGGAPPSREELAARYARQVVGRSADGTEAWHNWIIRRRPQGDAIGYVQATVSTLGGPADIAWVIGVPWQGRGFATEAAAAVRDGVRGPGSATGDDVTRVHAHIAPGHVASETVARRLGLTPTDVTHHGETRWLLTLSD